MLSLPVTRLNLLLSDTLATAIAVHTGRVSAPSTLSKLASEITIVGERPGDDQLILTPTGGVRGDTTRITVTEGRFKLSNPFPFSGISRDTLKVGAIYDQALNVADSTGTIRQVAAPLNAWLTTTDGLAVLSVGMVRIDSVQVPPFGAGIRLKASTAGSATLTVSRPGYVPFKKTFVIIP